MQFFSFKVGCIIPPYYDCKTIHYFKIARSAAPQSSYYTCTSRQYSLAHHDREYLQNSDRIFLLSDGFIHQFGGEKGSKKFSMKTLVSMLQSLHNSPMNLVRAQFVETFNNWQGQIQQTDDIVLIGLEIHLN